MFRLLFISGIVDHITVGQLHVGTVLIFYGGIVIGLFLKVITNSFGGESEASVRDFRSGLPGLRPRLFRLANGLNALNQIEEAWSGPCSVCAAKAISNLLRGGTIELKQ